MAQTIQGLYLAHGFWRGIGAHGDHAAHHPGVKSYLASWSGDCTGTGLTTQVTMDADKTCTAAFGYPVGGVAVPVNRLGLVAPWMGLAALASVAALTVMVVRRRGG